MEVNLCMQRNSSLSTQVVVHSTRRLSPSPHFHNHCLLPNWETKVPASPVLILILSTTAKTCPTATSGVVAPVKWGAYCWNFAPCAIAADTCSGGTIVVLATSSFTCYLGLLTVYIHVSGYIAGCNTQEQNSILRILSTELGYCHIQGCFADCVWTDPINVVPRDYIQVCVSCTDSNDFLSLTF